MIDLWVNINRATKLRIVLVLFMLPVSGWILNAQGDKKYIRHGNREYHDNKFSESEISYRRAIDKNKSSADAVFNIGDALYKQDKFEDAGKQFLENSVYNEDKIKKAAALYNLGNSLLMADKIQESIDAYKGSLRLYPDNIEAKYNLAYAQDLLQQQQQQQQKQEQQQDKQDQNKDNKNEDEKPQNQDQNEQQNQSENKEQESDQQQQADQQSISKEDAERLLNAIANDEKNVQEKVKRAKAAKTRARAVKNW